MDIAIKVEYAKKEILKNTEKLQKELSLPACIMEMVITSALAEVREASKREIISEASEEIRKKNEELEKAKAAAKKVLRNKTEDNREMENKE